MSRNGRRESISGRKENEIGCRRRIERRRESEEGDFGFKVLDLPFEFFLGFVGFFVAFFAGAGFIGVVILVARETPRDRGGEIIVVIVVVIAIGVNCAATRWHFF